MEGCLLPVLLSAAYSVGSSRGDTGRRRSRRGDAGTQMRHGFYLCGCGLRSMAEKELELLLSENNSEVKTI